MSDWIEWNGGECPVADGTLVDVKLRADVIVEQELAAGWFWEHGLVHDDGDIIAYRVVKEAPNISETHEDPFNQQIGGTHYKDMPIQPFEFSMKNGLDPMQHTIVKYVTRFRHKNGREDLEKAKHTIDLLIEHEYGDDWNGKRLD